MVCGVFEVLLRACVVGGCRCVVMGLMWLLPAFGMVAVVFVFDCGFLCFGGLWILVVLIWWVGTSAGWDWISWVGLVV